MKYIVDYKLRFFINSLSRGSEFWKDDYPLISCGCLKVNGYSMYEYVTTFFVSPTGCVIYSPDYGHYEYTGENVHEVDLDWRCQVEEDEFNKRVGDALG